MNNINQGQVANYFNEYLGAALQRTVVYLNRFSNELPNIHYLSRKHTSLEFPIEKVDQKWCRIHLKWRSQDRHLRAVIDLREIKIIWLSKKDKPNDKDPYDAPIPMIGTIMNLTRDETLIVDRVKKLSITLFSDHLKQTIESYLKNLETGYVQRKKIDSTFPLFVTDNSDIYLLTKFRIGKGSLKKVSLILDLKKIESLAGLISRTQDQTLIPLMKVEMLMNTKLQNIPGIIPTYVNTLEEKNKITTHFMIQKLCPLNSLWEQVDNLTNLDRFQVAYDVLMTFSYLHFNKIIHADVKPENILVYEMSDRKRAYLTDLMFCQRTFTNSPKQSGTLQYCAPELVNDLTKGVRNSSHFVHPARDLWAIGHVFMFLFRSNTDIPWISIYHENRHKPKVALKKMHHYFKNNPFLLHIDDQLDPLLVLIYQCFAYNPKERPTALEALNRLVTIAKDRGITLLEYQKPEENAQAVPGEQVGF